MRNGETGFVSLLSWCLPWKPLFWQLPFFLGSSIERGAEQILGVKEYLGVLFGSLLSVLGLCENGVLPRRRVSCPAFQRGDYSSFSVALLGRDVHHCRDILVSVLLACSFEDIQRRCFLIGRRNGISKFSLLESTLSPAGFLSSREVLQKSKSLSGSVDG